MTRFRPDSRLQDLLAGEGVFGRFIYLALNHCLVVSIGLGFWAVAARFVPARSVGLAAVAVSTAAFISALGALGIGSFLLAELNAVPDGDGRALITTGVAVVAATSGVLALITLGLSPFLGHNLSTLGRQPLDAALLLLCTICSGVGSLLDAAAIGLRRSPLQVVRNACASALRFVIIFPLIAVGVRSTEGLLLGWTLALLASFAIWPWLMPPHDGRASWTLRAASIRRYRSLALHHHVLNLAITSVTISLPALAAVLLVAKDYAYFAVAQLISSTALRLPALLAMSLFAEATGDLPLLRRSIRRTMPVALGICLLILLVLEPSASLVLSVFGHAYAAHGASTLRLLLLGGLAYVVKDHYVAIRRAQRRLTQAAKAVAMGTGAELGAAVIGAVLYGVRGLCAFWLITAMAEAAFFLPVVWRLIHDDADTASAVGITDFTHERRPDEACPAPVGCIPVRDISRSQDSAEISRIPDAGAYGSRHSRHATFRPHRRLLLTCEEIPNDETPR